MTQDPTAAARQAPGQEEVPGEVGEVGEAQEIEQKQLTFLGDEMLTMPVGGGATTTGAGVPPPMPPHLALPTRLNRRTAHRQTGHPRGWSCCGNPG